MKATANRKNVEPVFEPINLHVVIESAQERDLLYRALAHFAYKHTQIQRNKAALEEVCNALEGFGAQRDFRAPV